MKGMKKMPPKMPAVVADKGGGKKGAAAGPPMKVKKGGY